ncbi:MAG: TlpA family protein disulfide reductase [bacterium]
MRRVIFILLLSAAVLISGETYVKEGKSIKFESADDSLILYRNSNFFDREAIYPVKNNSYSHKIEKEDTIISIATFEDSLLEIYFVDRKDKTNKHIYLADNYAFFKKNEKALDNYLKAFYQNKNDYYVYDRMMDFYFAEYPESLESAMEKHLSENPNNVSVMYKNASLLREMDKDYSSLIEKILPLFEKSEPYFNSVLTAIYELEDADEDALNKAVAYSIDNFYDLSDFLFIIYHITDRYSGENEDSILSNKLVSLLNKQISDEVKFYTASYLADQNRSMNIAISSLKELMENEIYSEFGEYVLYSIAKAYLSSGEADSAVFFVKKALEEFAPRDYDFFRLMYDAAAAKDDTSMVMDAAFELLTYDRKSKEILDRVAAYSKMSSKDIDKKIDQYLETESEKKIFEETSLIDLNGKEHKFSKYKGKVVLIDFFATWCGPCKMEIKDLVQMKKEYSKEKKIAFVAVSSEIDADTIREFAKNMSFDFDIYYNGGELMDRESIKGVPTLYLIDKKGNLRYMRVGYSEENDKYLKTRIDYLLQK